MRRLIIAATIVCALSLPVILLAHGGFGGPGGRGRANNQNNPQKQAIQLQDKIDEFTKDGFAALKVYDTASAVADFSDVIQLQPENALAHLGLGLAKAQKGKFAASETEFSAAMSYARKTKENPPPNPAPIPANNQFFANPSPSNAPAKAADPKAEAIADLRLATFDLAVASTRALEKSRGLVLIDRLLAESKPTDEMLLNAQRSLLASIDTKTQETIGALPNMVKTMDGANTVVRAQHAPLRRWGVVWMVSEEVTHHRMSRETEPLPVQLPFLLPNDEVLPEGKKPDAPIVNPLLPVVRTPAEPSGGQLAAGADSTAPASTTNPAATTAPSEAMSGAGGGRPDTQPARITRRTVIGAAFAVAPDLLVTCSRITGGAKSIQVQAVDGTNYAATLVSSDDAAQLALIKVEGGRFPPLTLAAAARPGAVRVAAFPKPGVFGPEMQVLQGELTFIPGAWLLHLATHPRSAGSPLVNDQDQVMGMLTASRDDAASRLPVVPIDVIRKFVDGKLPAGIPSGEPTAEQSVLEVSASRED